MGVELVLEFMASTMAVAIRGAFRKARKIEAAERKANVELGQYLSMV